MTRTEAPAFDNTCAALIPLHPAPTMTASYMTPSVGLTDTGEAVELLVVMGLFDGAFDGLVVGLFDGLDVGSLVGGLKVIRLKVGAGDVEGSDVGKSSRGGDCTGGIISSVIIGESMSSVIAAES